MSLTRFTANIIIDHHERCNQAAGRLDSRPGPVAMNSAGCDALRRGSRASPQTGGRGMKDRDGWPRLSELDEMSFGRGETKQAEESPATPRARWQQQGSRAAGPLAPPAHHTFSRPQRSSSAQRAAWRRHSDPGALSRGDRPQTPAAASSSSSSTSVNTP